LTFGKGIQRIPYADDSVIISKSEDELQMAASEVTKLLINMALKYPLPKKRIIR
jgi:hypothetical protein